LAVKIRLMRVGRNNRPSYRIVATDSRTPRDGKVLEVVGFYDPMSKEADKQVTLDTERAKYWLSVGAQTTETVSSILKKKGLKPRPK
jgi:small subunit ribosomal protein S16